MDCYGWLVFMEKPVPRVKCTYLLCFDFGLSFLFRFEIFLFPPEKLREKKNSPQTHVCILRKQWNTCDNSKHCHCMGKIYQNINI